MDTRIKGVLGGMAAILLFGAGCAEVPPAPPEEKPAESFMPTEVNTKPAEEMVVEKPSTDLTLKGEPIGSGQVKFTWTAPEGLNEANRFIIVESEDINPVHDGKHNWLRQYYTNRAVVWNGRSIGTKHYRICLTENNEHDTCVTYSEDVVVDVR